MAVPDATTDANGDADARGGVVFRCCVVDEAAPEATGDVVDKLLLAKGGILLVDCLPEAVEALDVVATVDDVPELVLVRLVVGFCCCWFPRR